MMNNRSCGQNRQIPSNNFPYGREQGCGLGPANHNNCGQFSYEMPRPCPSNNQNSCERQNTSAQNNCKCHCEHPNLSSPSSSCECIKDNCCLKDMPIAMAYVPWQTWRHVVNGKVGLRQGTIFNELVKPFHCEAAKCEGRCHCR